MELEIKNKFTTALRSGNYPQCRHRLVNRTNKGTIVGYCCLGVLATVCGMEVSEDGESIVKNGHDEGYGPLSDLLGGHEYAGILWKMNDKENKTFDEIADYVEKNL